MQIFIKPLNFTCKYQSVLNVLLTLVPDSYLGEKI